MKFNCWNYRNCWSRLNRQKTTKWTRRSGDAFVFCAEEANRRWRHQTLRPLSGAILGLGERRVVANWHLDEMRREISSILNFCRAGHHRGKTT